PPGVAPFRWLLPPPCPSRFLWLAGPMRAAWFGSVWSRDFNAWSCSINDPQRITAEHEQLCGFLECLSPHIGFPSLIAPLQNRSHELHQVIHRHAAGVGRIEDRLREPGVDGAC